MSNNTFSATTVNNNNMILDRTALQVINAHIASIVIYKEGMKRVVSVTGTKTNPKTKKGKVTSKKVTLIPTGIQVVDTQATIIARLVARKSAQIINNAVVIASAARAELKQRSADKIATAQYNEQCSKYLEELNIINNQLISYKTFAHGHKGHFKARAIEKKVGSASAGAIRNADRIERGIAQAKRMVAKAIVAKYTKTVNTTVISQAPKVPAFGTAVSSLYSIISYNYVANNNEPIQSIRQFITDELDQAIINHLDAIAQDDFGCGVYSSIEQALRETALNYKSILADNPVSCVNQRQSDSPATSEVSENLVKHGQTNNNNSTGGAMLTTILSNILFPAVSSLRTDLGADEKAKRENERLERRNAFEAEFSAKLITPEMDNLLVVAKKDSNFAMAKLSANSNLFDFFTIFNLYGVNINGEGQPVKFAGQKIEQAKGSVEGHYLTNTPAFFARCFAHATHQLSAEEKVRFCRLIHKGEGTAYKTTATSVVIGGAKFNFLQGTVETANQAFIANPTIEIDGANFDGAHAVFLLALSCFGNTGKAVNVIIQRAVSLFERDENYGAKLSEFDLASGIAHNLELTTEFHPSRLTNKFPFFSMVASKSQDEQKLSKILSDGGVAVVDKYNMKWAAKGVGAEAVLVGRDGDTILNLNDANKTAKVYNRPASIKYTFAEVEGRTKSNFAVALSNGKSLYSCGKKLRTAWANSRYGHGSGVAVINPATSFNYVVPKSLRGVFNILTLPASLRAGKSYSEVVNTMLANLNNKIQGVIGKTFAPGEAVLEFNLNGTKQTVLHNNAKAVNINVKSGSCAVTSDYEIDIKLNVEIVGVNEQFVKLRGIGKKCTTLPYEILGLGNDWDILLNIEAVKGNPALVEMYANSFGQDCFYNSNKGILTTPAGDVDLTAKSNAFTEWASNTSKETIISFEMSRSCYEAHKRVIAPYATESLEELQALVGKGEGKDTFVEIVNDTKVVIHERVEYIIGEVVFDIEVATPKESVSTTNFTLEAANGLLLQDRALGEAVMADMLPKLTGAESLVQSFMKLGDLPKFNVLTSAGREALASAFEVPPAKRGGFANHRTVLNELREVFPQGFIIECPTRTGVISFEVHPRALSAFGGFTGNGSATREIADVINFIYFITDEVSAEGSVDKAIIQLCSNLSNTLTWWATNLVKSKSVMKKFTRSGSLIGGKVRSTYSPLVNSRNVYGPDNVLYTLPVVAINPDGPIARFLGVESGNVVGITRTPMPFMTACIVIKSDEVPVGHIFVSPEVWHKANEGDSRLSG